MGRLCQGMVRSTEGKGKRVEGTDNFFVVKYNEIPTYRRKEITYTSVVCEVRPQKEDPNCTRITIGGNCICYPGDVGTLTASLELFKLLIYSVLYRKGARFVWFDINNFYLVIPLNHPEYVRIHLKEIPQKFITKYNFTTYAHYGWVYFRIYKGVYGITHTGKLSNDLLHKRLNTKRYYEATTTPGLWIHKWRPVMFCLTIDNFGIKYVGKQYAQHILSTLQEDYMVTTDWEGKKYTGIDLKWEYKYCTCWLTM